MLSGWAAGVELVTVPKYDILSSTSETSGTERMGGMPSGGSSIGKEKSSMGRLF